MMGGKRGVSLARRLAGVATVALGCAGFVLSFLSAGQSGIDVFTDPVLFLTIASVLIGGAAGWVASPYLGGPGLRGWAVALAVFYVCTVACGGVIGGAFGLRETWSPTAEAATVAYVVSFAGVSGALLGAVAPFALFSDVASASLCWWAGFAFAHLAPRCLMTERA